MSDLLPPLIMELRAKAGELYSELGKVKTETAKMAKDTDVQTSKMGSAYKGAAGVGKAAILGIAGAAAIVGVASVKMATDYQELTTQLVTGAGESEENIKMVSAGLLKMAPAVGMGPAALAKAMFTVESAGYHAADGLAVMKAAAEGAKIGGSDATTVANGLTTALTDYHLKATDAATVTSKLVTTVASGKTTMGDLSGALSAVLPSAAAAGVGLDQVLGAMATMTGEGISAQQASQDLAGTIRSLQNPTQQQTATMTALGLSSLDVAKNLGKKGLTGTLGDLVAAITQHMGPAGTVIEDTFKKSQLAAQDANTELAAMPKSIQGIAKQFQAGTISSSDWRGALKGMTVEQKQMAQQFATTVQSGRGFNDLLKAGGPSAQTFSAALSKVTGGSTGMNTALALTGGNLATFQANVKGISGAAVEAGGHVKGWAETQKDFATQIAQAKAGVEAMGIKIGLILIPYIQKAIVVGTKMTDWLLKHKPVLIAIAAVIGTVLVGAITAFTVSLFTAGGALAFVLSPVFLVAAAVAALVVGVIYAYKHFKTFHSIIDGIGRVLKTVWNDVLKPVVGFFMHNWKTALEVALVVVAPFIGLPLLIEQNWGKITAFFSGMWNTVVGYFKDAVSWLTQAGQDIINGVWGGIQTAWATVTGFFTGIGKTIANWFNGAIAWLKQAGQDVINGLWAGVQAVWNGTVMPWVNFQKKILGWFAGAASWLVQGGKDILSGLWSGIKDIWNNDIAFFQNMGSTFTDWFKGASSWLVGVGGDIIRGLIQGIKNAAGGVAGALKDVVTSLPGASLLKDVPGLGGFFKKDGGFIPGAPGQPVQGTAHGGEYVLSQAMLAGRQKVDPGVLKALAGKSIAENRQKHMAADGGNSYSVEINAVTNASPNQIATSVGWELRRMG